MNATAEDNVTSTLWIVALLLVGLNLFGALVPDISNWGFNRWSLFPTPIAIPSLALLLLLSLPATSRLICRLFQMDKSHLSFFGRAWLVRSCYIAALVGLLMALYVLRSRALVYGDGFTVLAHITGNPDQLIFDQYKLQIGSILLKRYTYLAVTSYVDTDPAMLLSLLNIIGGIGGIIAIYLVSGLLAQNKWRWHFIIGASSSAAVMLFFGHIESYTWPLSMGLLSLYFSMRTARGERFGMVAVVFGITATFFHMIALPFLGLTAIVLVWSCYRTRDPEFVLTARIVSVCATLFSTVLVSLFQIEGYPDVFVPFFSKLDNHYAAFSWPHIRDILNMVVFMAPLSLWFLPATLFHRKRVHGGTRESRILGCLALFTFLPCFWIDPALGMVRDWDLFAQFGIPLSLYVISKCETIHSKEMVRHWTSLLLLIALVNLLPNIYENMNLQRSTAYLDRMLWNDVHYQEKYYDGKRCLSWGSILRTNVQRPDLAEKYFVRRIRANEKEYAAWNTLGEMAFERKDYDSAVSCFAQSLENNPDQPPHYLRLTQTLGLAERWQEALDVARVAVFRNPEDARAKYNLGMLLFQSDKHREALNIFQGIADLALYQSTDIEAYLGTGFLKFQQWDSAYFYLKKFIVRHPDRNQIRESLLKATIALGQYDEARNTVAVLKLHGYSPDALAEYERLIRRSDRNSKK